MKYHLDCSAEELAIMDRAVTVLRSQVSIITKPELEQLARDIHAKILQGFGFCQRQLKREDPHD